MFLVVARSPEDPAAVARAADITGLVLYDVRQRLAGMLPRVLLVDAAAEKLQAASAALTPLGFATFVCDPLAVPTDDDRVVARQLVQTRGGFAVLDAAGTRHDCPPAAIGLVQRGWRTSRTTINEKVTERKIDLTRAIASGGLLLSKKVERTETKTTVAREAFVLVQRNDGAPDIVLYEQRMDYRSLGPLLSVSSLANLEIVAGELRALAPAAPHDDRVGRPGFVEGLPATRADRVDVALHLVALARLVLGRHAPA